MHLDVSNAERQLVDDRNGFADDAKEPATARPFIRHVPDAKGNSRGSEALRQHLHLAAKLRLVVVLKILKMTGQQLELLADPELTGQHAAVPVRLAHVLGL